MKKLVLFVEGDGDEEAVPVLVKRLITDLNLWDQLQLDPAPFRVGGTSAVLGNPRKLERWTRHVQAACRRPGMGGILQVLDGDARNFCATESAWLLASRARQVGAGAVFSFASVFACREYESWLLAGIESLAGKPFKDGRPGVSAGAKSPHANLELAPRDAKGVLDDFMPRKYKATTDQKPLTELVDLAAIRSCNLRSFRRLENALFQLSQAFQTDQHISTPPAAE
jgi:hypothetical protein